MCETLELKFEDESEQKAYGGEYEYIGTVKLNDGKLRPFYKQKDHGTSGGPIHMHHTGDYFSATVNIFEN